jgi:hypothetical protein
MLRERVPVCVAQLLQQACRAFDIGEQEGDGSGWQIAHRNPHDAPTRSRRPRKHRPLAGRTPHSSTIRARSFKSVGPEEAEPGTELVVPTVPGRAITLSVLAVAAEIERRRNDRWRVRPVLAELDANWERAEAHLPLDTIEPLP